MPTERQRPDRPEKIRKLFKIGELIERSGISRQTLHNYTMLGLIEPASRTQSGHRLYTEEAFELLERIKQLRRTHTLMEIRDLLGRSHRTPPSKSGGRAPKSPEDGGGAGR
jgi:DNA-binding transcriptional MerR regulator